VVSLVGAERPCRKSRGKIAQENAGSKRQREIYFSSTMRETLVLQPLQRIAARGLSSNGHTASVRFLLRTSS